MTQIALDIIKPPTASTNERTAASEDGRFSERLADAADQQDRVTQPKENRHSNADSKSTADDNKTEANLSDDGGVQSQAQPAAEEPTEDNATDTENQPVVADVQDVVVLSEEVVHAEDVNAEAEQTIASEEQPESDGEPTKPLPTDAQSAGKEQSGEESESTASQELIVEAQDKNNEANAQRAHQQTTEESDSDGVDKSASETDIPKKNGEFQANANAPAAEPTAEAIATTVEQTTENDSESLVADETKVRPAARRKPVKQSATDAEREASRTTATSNETNQPSEEITPVLTTELATDNAEGTSDEDQPTANAEAKQDQARSEPARSFDRVAERLTAARKAEQSGVSTESRVDPSRFVSRVSRAFETAQQRGDAVRIRLSPPELGSMQIKLSFSNEGTMQASVETETAAARNVLLDNLPALRDRLAGMEIRIEKFDVNVGQQGSGGQDWRPGEGQDERPGHDGSPRRESRQQSQTQTATSKPNPSPNTGGGPDQINLVA